MTIAELISSGALRRIRPDPLAASSMMAKARASLAAAAVVRDTSPDAAVILSHDASRQAITALMRSEGHRPRQGGAHTTAAEFAREALGDAHAEITAELHRLRRQRHSIEYDDGSFASAEEAVWAHQLAFGVIAAIEEILTGRDLNDA